MKLRYANGAVNQLYKHMGLEARINPVSRVSDHLRLKPACSATAGTQYKGTGHLRKYKSMLSRLYFSAISKHYSQ